MTVSIPIARAVRRDPGDAQIELVAVGNMRGYVG